MPPPNFLIIHDNDNNLVYEDVTFHAYRAIARRRGVSSANLPSIESLTRDYAGKRYEGALQDMEAKLGFQIESPYKTVYEAEVLSQQKLHLRLLPLVRGTLSILNRAGIDQCVATNNSRQVVENGYRVLKIDNFFKFVVSADDVQPGEYKPHPKLLQIALARGQSTTDNCVHIEDSNSGLESGHNAGIKNLVWHVSTIPPALCNERQAGQAEKGILPAAVIEDYAGLIPFILKVAPLAERARLEAVVAGLNALRPGGSSDICRNAAAIAEESPTTLLGISRKPRPEREPATE
jgi:HAD superfamily hydrolase (TIGR01509 family)